MTGRLLLLTQDPAARGGAATVISAARDLLGAQGVDFDHVYPAVLTQPRISLVRPEWSWRASTPGHMPGSTGLLAVLPELQVPAYLSAGLALRGLAQGRGWSGVLVCGASAMHGSIAAGLDLPHVVWIATTLSDERSAQWSSYSSGRRLIHRVTLQALERREDRTLRSSRGTMVMGAHGRWLLEQRSLACLGDMYPPIRDNRHEPERRVAELRSKRLQLIFVGRVTDERKRFGLALEIAGHLAGSGGFDRVTLDVTATAGELAPYACPPGLELNALGHPDDDALAAAYGRAHVLLLTSRQEGFGLVTAEAMTAGALCVTTCSGGPEEVVRLGGGAVHDDLGVLSGFILSLASRPSFWGAASVQTAAFARETFGREPAQQQMSALLGALA